MKWLFLQFKIYCEMLFQFDEVLDLKYFLMSCYLEIIDVKLVYVIGLVSYDKDNVLIMVKIDVMLILLFSCLLMLVDVLLVF